MHFNTRGVEATSCLRLNDACHILASAADQQALPVLATMPAGRSVALVANFWVASSVARLRRMLRDEPPYVDTRRGLRPRYG